MKECAAAQVARVGVDLSKRVYQVHAVDRSGKVVFAKPVSPERFLTCALICRQAASLQGRPAAARTTWHVACSRWVWMRG